MFTLVNISKLIRMTCIEERQLSIELKLSRYLTQLKQSIEIELECKECVFTILKHFILY